MGPILQVAATNEAMDYPGKQQFDLVETEEFCVCADSVVGTHTEKSLPTSRITKWLGVETIPQLLIISLP